MCKMKVQELYTHWVTAALPRALPAAFRELYPADRSSAPAEVAVAGPKKEADLWRKAALLSPAALSLFG